ncbi:MAG: thioredoxin domain-containing protein [Ornithinimicrobium sp.]
MSRPPAPKAPGSTTTGPPLSLIAVVIAVLAVVVAVVVYLAVRDDGEVDQQGGDAAQSADAQRSAGALPDGGGLVVNPDVDDVPQVHLYEDFQCPFCAQLERTSGAAIAQAATDGEINLTYTFMSFLDDSLGNDSSARAANAAVCSADAGKVSTFAEGVFDQQPATEGEGYSDQVFRDVAKDVGIEGTELATFTSCVQDRSYAAYVDDMQQRASQDGVTSSPVVMIDGEPISDEELSLLLQDPTSFSTVIAARS